MSLLQELATEARRINAANGWGLTFGQNGDQEIPGYLALIHSEISEAYSATTDELATRELGDVIVRCLDFIELLSPGALNAKPLLKRWTRPIEIRYFDWRDELMAMHGQTSYALEAYRKDEQPTARIVFFVGTVLERAWRVMGTIVPGCDQEQIIREILEANSKRAYRHGGRRT